MRFQQGFSVVELMVVMAISGILIAIGLPNFAQAQNRARTAAVKSNMHKVHNAIDLYGIDWDGKYPKNIQRLRKEALALTTDTVGYWSSFENPFTGDSGINNSMRNLNVRKKHVRPNNPVSVNNSFGMVVYDTNGYYKNNLETYAIYGVDSNNKLLSFNGYPFFLSNS